MTMGKATWVWLLVVGTMIGLQLDPQVCSSDGARAMSLLVGYVVVSGTVFVLGSMVKDFLLLNVMLVTSTQK